MGFFNTLLKDKKAVEIQLEFLRMPGNIYFYQIGQQIRNSEPIEEIHREGIWSALKVVENYLISIQIEIESGQTSKNNKFMDETFEQTVKGLTIYSIIKSGYNLEEYDPNKIIRYAKKLYISMTGTPNIFKVEHMPVINDLANQLKNKKVNIQQEKTAEELEEFNEMIMNIDISPEGQKKYAEEEMRQKKSVETKFIKNNENKKKKEKKQQQEVEEEIYEVSRKLNKNGTTTIRYSDKDRFTGYLDKNDEWHGLGTHYYPSGEKFVGEFKNGWRDGFGTLYFSNGAKHIGEFKKGYREGYGIEIDENGDTSAAGIWEKDEYLDQSILGRMDKWLDKYE